MRSDHAPSSLFGDDAGHTYEAVLRALSAEVLDAELAGIEAASTARRPMADVREEQVAATHEMEEDVEDQLPAFRAALEDARRRQDPGGAASYDSSDSEQDRIADLLIRYLVRADYATVHTEEPQPRRYLYRIQVDWARLEALAGRVAGRSSG